MSENIEISEEIQSRKAENLFEYSMNRELSWLNFNKRVLYESIDSLTPDFEKLKFVSIFTSNLEEFYRVRVGSLTDLSYVNDANADNKTGMSAKEQLKAIFLKTEELLKEKDTIYESVMENLNSHGIYDVDYSELSKKEKKKVHKYYTDYIDPILSPQIIDFHHPFPFIENNKLYIALEISDKNTKSFGLVFVPDNLKKYYIL